MAKIKKESYPKVKYRLVTGNGPSIYYSEDELNKKIHEYRTNSSYKDREDFQPQYIIKITEEYIEV